MSRSSGSEPFWIKMVFNRAKRGDGVDGGGEATGPEPPAPHAPIAKVERSGVWPRAQPAAPGAPEVRRHEGPCASFEDIYHRFRPYVWRLLARTTLDDAAEDLAQKVFETMNIHIEDNGVPVDAMGLLRTMTGHVICNHLRERAKHRKALDREADAEVVPASKRDPEQLVAGAEQKQMVAEILAEMLPLEAVYIRLLDLGDYSAEEIGAILKVPGSTVRMRYRRARAEFRKVGERLFFRNDRGVQ
jgi:RNA polymerase sigma factor (sigma-70 family)